MLSLLKVPQAARRKERWTDRRSSWWRPSVSRWRLCSASSLLDQSASQINLRRGGTEESLQIIIDKLTRFGLSFRDSSEWHFHTCNLFVFHIVDYHSFIRNRKNWWTCWLLGCVTNGDCKRYQSALWEGKSEPPPSVYEDKVWDHIALWQKTGGSC